MNTNDQITSERLAKELIQGMKDITNEVANDIVICNKESKLYNLYEHYKRYGLSPYDIKNIAKILDQEEISKIGGMLRRTSLYELNFYLENQKVNYDKKLLTKVLNTLDEESVPIYKGTLFEGLKLEKERSISEKSNKILKKLL